MKRLRWLPLLLLGCSSPPTGNAAPNLPANPSPNPDEMDLEASYDSGTPTPVPTASSGDASPAPLDRCPSLWDNWTEFESRHRLKFLGTLPLSAYDGPATVVASSADALQLTVESKELGIELSGGQIPVLTAGDELTLRLEDTSGFRDSSRIIEILSGQELLFFHARFEVERISERLEELLNLPISVSLFCDASRECMPRQFLRLTLDPDVTLQPFQFAEINLAPGSTYYVAVHSADQTSRPEPECQTASQRPYGVYADLFLVRR